MIDPKTKNWMAEYESFLKADAEVVPQSLTSQVMSRLAPLLNPNASSVFAKLLGIHLVMGFLSLGVCHQFGMNPFGTDRSLDDWFMSMWGHGTCMLACGGLFMSASLLCAAGFLSIEELRSLKRTEFLQSLGLGGISLLVFIVFGAELAFTLAGLWLLGAFVGGIVATEVAWAFKNYRVQA